MTAKPKEPERGCPAWPSEDIIEAEGLGAYYTFVGVPESSWRWEVDVLNGDEDLDNE